MQISISDLRNYMACPRRYWLSEVEGIKPENRRLAYCRSKAIKQILAILHDQNKKLSEYTKKEVYATCERIWNAIIDDELVSSEEIHEIVVKAKKKTKAKPATPAITKSERILENIQQWIFEYSRREGEVEILYTNVYFQTQISDVTFVGYIDMIRKVNDTIEVLIFNSSAQQPNIDFLLNDYTTSLIAHAILRGTLYPNYPDLENPKELKTLPQIKVYHLPHLAEKKKRNKETPPLSWDISRTTDDLIQFEYELLHAISGIQNEYYAKTPVNPCGCSLCPFQKACSSHSPFTLEDTSFDTAKYEEEITV